MKKVNTIRGPIAISELGVTLMHEHIFILSTEINQNYPEKWGDEEHRIQEAVGLFQKMVLSQDAACYNNWFDAKELAARAPRWSFFHILNVVIPALKEQGVTDEQIRTMLVENPRSFFEGNE